MKLLTVFALALAVPSAAALGQGVLNFANSGNGVEAPVSDWDGTTKLFGPTFVADLSWAPGIVTDSTVLTALGEPAAFATNGYFFGGIRTIPNAAPGNIITCQVWAWDVPDGYSWKSPLPGFYPPSERVGWSGLFPVVLAASASSAPNLAGLIPFQTHPLVLSPPNPIVAISERADTLVFSWPSYWKGWTFALQESADASSANWLTLTNTPMLTGSQAQILYQISIAKPASTTFYRLVQ